MATDEKMAPLMDYLRRLPGVSVLSAGTFESDGRWWVKFGIDIHHRLAWRVVQELGHVLNYLSVKDRLPTVFMPVSPPPYMNGGPEDFLAWVVESRAADVDPKLIAEWLEGRLPRPVESTKEWDLD
ncbi:MAG TPA: hypothetical protein VI356_20455 [Myxococcales bacterium]